MRLWSLHPQYLDRQGLLAVWREGLLAQAVLQGRTRGYKNHPQLTRFKRHPDPLGAIAFYLSIIHEEATKRGYHFDSTKFELNRRPEPIPATSGQLDFELKHLQQKFHKRSQADYTALLKGEYIDSHPLFQIVPGNTEAWEKGIWLILGKRLNTNHPRSELLSEGVPKPRCVIMPMKPRLAAHSPAC